MHSKLYRRDRVYVWYGSYQVRFPSRKTFHRDENGEEHKTEYKEAFCGARLDAVENNGG